LQSGGPGIDDETRDLLTTALQSKDPAVIRSALGVLVYSPPNASGEAQPRPHLVFQPDLVPLFFHSDETVQQEARRVLRYVKDDDAPQVVKSLINVLEDESRKNDHLAAVRALGWIGPGAAAALPNLEGTVSNASAELVLRVAAACAADAIERENRFHSQILSSGRDEKEQTQINRLVSEEQKIR
jgi:HEAT repeat protein